MLKCSFEWDDLRFFLNLAQTGTLAGTGRSMDVSHVTVSRRIANLERSLGHPLILRRPDGYRLTPAGQAILPLVREMEQMANAIARQTFQKTDLTGVVRLAVGATLADYFVAPRLAEFTRMNPGVLIDLASDMCGQGIARREADLAIFLERPSGEETIIRRLGELCYGFYQAVEATGEQPFISYPEGGPASAEADWLRRFVGNRRVALQTSSIATQMAAAERGVGMALLPHYIAKTNPRLKPAQVEDAPPSREIWLAWPSPCAQACHVRRFIDFIVALFHSERCLFLPLLPTEQP